MVSDRLFEDLCLPPIERECAHMDCSIYHLDGPGALRFLDRIMDVPKIQAIQWVPGAGRDGWREWVSVYRRIQARGKSFIAYVPAADVEAFTGIFRPEGAWLDVSGVSSAEEAETVMKTIRKWR
jgi:hypothetical protein